MFPIDAEKFWHQLTYHPKEPLIFSSGVFLFLFAGFMLVYFALHRQHRAKTVFVTLFSLYFYYKSSGVYFLLLVLATVVDYLLAALIHRSEKDWQKRAVLVFSLVLNLGLLGYFKYTNFFYEMFCRVAEKPYDPFEIFLPVGVSFFTFQSLSYTIDIYRGVLKPVRNILDYAFFVSFFPQLVAGPIVRAVDFIPQIFVPVKVTREMLGRGIFLIAAGLFKKTVIADYVSVNFVDRIFESPSLYTGFENLMGVYAYAIQIYCDFSGYSDMAIGIALLMGFHFNLNFDSPYQSRNITEFWRRWHISLSTWLRDYLYISLGGNRKGKFRTYVNLFLTMLLGGLWHGAGFRFVLWGAMHGLALGLHKFYLSLFPPKKPSIPENGLWARLKGGLGTVLGVLLTFHFVCFCWIFFRAENMDIAGQVISQIVWNFHPHVWWDFLVGYPVVVQVMALGFVLHFLPGAWEKKAQQAVAWSPLPLKLAFLVLAVLVAVQFKSAEIQPFIYFQF
jgi:alginate O-acetyltransferase complex protein AlgI